MTDFSRIRSRFWRRQARMITLVGGAGILLAAAVLLPWINGVGDTVAEVHGGTALGAVGYRSGGDRIVLGVLGISIAVLAVGWLFARAWLTARVLIIVAGLLAAAWASLPILEVGTLEDGGADGLPVSVGIGPFAALVIAIGIVIAATWLRPDDDTAQIAGTAARRAAEKGRVHLAVGLAQSSMQILQRRHGPRDARTVVAARFYADCLADAGFDSEERALRERLTLARED